MRHFPLPNTERYEEVLAYLRMNRVDDRLVEEGLFVPLPPN